MFCFVPSSFIPFSLSHGVHCRLLPPTQYRQLEADEAVRVAQLGQSESAARVSSLRNDYETKISFLLAQLRAAESELKQSTGLLRKSLSGSTSGSISGGVGMNMNMNSNPNSRSTDRQQSAVSGGVGATIDLRGGGLLAHDGTPPRAGVISDFTFHILHFTCYIVLYMTLRLRVCM